MPAPRIALPPSGLPETLDDAIADAIRAGGGAVTEPEQADALVWVDLRDVEGLRAVLDRGPNITWVQLPWAGVERYAEANVFADGRTWTCGKGVYAEPVAEHALAIGLAGLRCVHDYARATAWTGECGRTLYDGNVTILGAGGIAESLLALLQPFRAETTVVRRAADPMPGATRTITIDRLHDGLRGADLVVVALALTPDTTHVIDAAALATMEPHAWLVNVGRGAHVDTEALVDALVAKRIGGAALDVTDPEPLPAGHQLWTMPNCLITPHTANTLELARKPLMERITDNVRRRAAGEPLIGLVDPQLGY